MADAVTSQTLLDGSHLAVMKFTDVSDGTGEAAVLKVDVSTLASSPAGKACTGVKLRKITSSIFGMCVNVLWDATADVTAFVLAEGNQTFHFDPSLPNNAGAGVTGDVLFTTIGHTAGDTYSIVLEMEKVYAA
jgi:hypothetical protein